MKKMPGEVLLEELNKLRDRLIHSGVERTVGLRDHMGSDCIHYRKSMDLFLKKDYIELRDLINNINKLFKEIEG